MIEAFFKVLSIDGERHIVPFLLEYRDNRDEVDVLISSEISDKCAKSIYNGYQGIRFTGNCTNYGREYDRREVSRIIHIMYERFRREYPYFEFEQSEDKYILKAVPEDLVSTFYKL